MTRIEQIKKLLAMADEEELSVSEHRWEASRLIWEEIEDGATQRGLAKEIGKSHTHVRYMYNTWNLIGQRLPADALPNFNTAYNSPEVRGEAADEEDSGSGDRRRRGLDGNRGDYSTSGLVLQAVNAIDALARNPAHWETITEEELARLEEIPARIRRIVRHSRS